MEAEKKINNPIDRDYGLKNVFIYWFPIVIYCFLIFIQSSYPSPKSVPDLPYIDKILHFSAYAILGALFFRAFKSLNRISNIKIIIFLSILFSSLYGAGDEFHQYFVPYRTADLMDALADITGSFFGVYTYIFISSRFPVS